MTASRTRPGMSWIVTGGALALVGLVIILWPEPGFTPHPLPFPPSASTRPIAGYAVFGYPLLAPVFHDGADDGIAAWGESMTVRGYDIGPAGAAGLRFSGW